MFSSAIVRVITLQINQSLVWKGQVYDLYLKLVKNNFMLSKTVPVCVPEKGANLKASVWEELGGHTFLSLVLLVPYLWFFAMAVDHLQTQQACRTVTTGHHDVPFPTDKNCDNKKKKLNYQLKCLDIILQTSSKLVKRQLISLNLFLSFSKINLSLNLN